MFLVLGLVRRAVDVAIPAGDVGTLLLLSLAIFGLRLGEGAIALWLRWKNLRIVKEAVKALRRDLVVRLYALPRTVQTKADLDDLHSRVVLDTGRVDEMASAALSSLVPAVFATLTLIGVLCVLDWRLLLLAASLVPMLWLAAGRTGALLESRVVAFQRAFESFAKGTRFVLHHMDLTRMQGSEEFETERQSRVVSDLGDKTLSMATGYAIHGQVQSLIVSFAGVLVFCGGGIAIGSGRLTLGEFLAFFVAAMFLNSQVAKISGGLPYLVIGNASLTTLSRLWMESRAAYGGRRSPSFVDSLRLIDVTYGYGEAPILRKVSLTIRPGSTIAIIGPNGAGKSTLLYLIAGVCRPWRGHLEADGVAYDELDLQALRRLGRFVLQHTQLFNGSVIENLRYGTPDATRADVVHAARSALAHEFIERLPEGYETRVGPDGLRLSGGERQRLVIARALLGNPRFLILDEPTNHLDTPTVASLMTTLLRLPQRPAIVAISHDSRVAAHMAEVYEVRDGRLRVRRSSAIAGLAAVHDRKPEVSG
jgi:ABC-type multidrug transport system fused ATPase/permease subunit